MKYNVRIVKANGTSSILEHKGRTEWCKRSAEKHMRTFIHYCETDRLEVVPA